MKLPNSDRIPFPDLPETIKTQYGIQDLWMRPFGEEAEDREVNFQQPWRPHLEIQILQCCTRDGQDKKLGSQFFWDLEVSKRLESLLAIATVADRHQFAIPLRCSSPTCREGIEIYLSMEEVSQFQSSKKPSPPATITVGQQTIQLRKPTGFDQLHWLAQSFTDEGAAAQVMVRTLIREKEQQLTPDLEAIAPEDWLPNFNQTMEAIDPLVNFQVQVQCPCCGVQNSHSLDLGAFALQRLQDKQQQLLALIHRLASSYHWNEAEILAIPPWRRRSYLARIERENQR